ncbi:MAG: SOS response-associated peptidase [Spirochaetales bacterium]|nr:SOS response-associated peptidase [Spirochaetales bacterium]
MCFSVALTRETIENDPRFHHLLDELYQNPGFKISGFSFPGLPVLRESLDGRGEILSWGLIPSWVTDPDKAKKIRSGTLNARSETLKEKPSFRDSWPQKRCILPVEGFYEPHVEGKQKTTWYIRSRRKKLLYLGCIWQENRHLPENWPPVSFSILTTASTDLLSEVHNEKLRMPVMLSAEGAAQWLEKGTPDLKEKRWHLNQEELEAWECLPGGREKAEAPEEWKQGKLF